MGFDDATVAETEEAPSPRLRGEGWGEGVQVSERKLPLTHAFGATSPRKRGEVKEAHP